MFAMYFASLRAKEKWDFLCCCLNVGDLGINGVNMSGKVLCNLVVDIFGWFLLLSHKVETEVDDNWHMMKTAYKTEQGTEKESVCFCVNK